MSDILASAPIAPAPSAAAAPSPVPSFAASPGAAFNPGKASDDDLLARYVTDAPELAPEADAGATDTPGAPGAPGVTFDEAVGRHRDATGRFVKPDGSPEDDAAADEAPAAETPEPAPEDEAAAPAKDGKDGKAPAFRVFDAAGELDVGADVRVEVKINGAVKQLPLSDVVRIAQSKEGSAEHARAARAEAEQAAQRVTAVQQHYQQQLTHAQQALQAAQQREQQIDQQIAALFDDPASFEAARAQYAAQNSPELRVARAEARVRQLQEQSAHQQATAFGQQQIATQIAPRLEALYQHAGDDPVLREAIDARAYKLIDAVKAHYGVQGMVPPQLLPEVAALFDRELTPWVTALHAQRARTQQDAEATATAARQATEAKAAAQVAAAQRAAAQVRRSFARAATPAGRAAPDVPARKPVRTADDAKDAILDNLDRYIPAA